MTVIDYLGLVLLLCVSISLFFTIVSILKKIHNGQETSQSTFVGSLLFAYIILYFALLIQGIFNYI